MDRLNRAVRVLSWIGFRNLLFLGAGSVFVAAELSQTRKVANPSIFFRKKQSQNLY